MMAAREGNYREVGRRVGGTVYAIFEGFTKPGKLDRLATKTPAQLKKLFPISAATRIEKQIIQDAARADRLEIGIRATDPITASIRKVSTRLKLDNRPARISQKSTLGLLSDSKTKKWIQSDLDVSHIIQDGKLLNNNEGVKYLGEINRQLIQAVVKPPFQHGSHITASQLYQGPKNLKDHGKIGGPGPVTVFDGKGAKPLSAAQVDKVFEKSAMVPIQPGAIPNRFGITIFKRRLRNSCFR